MPSESIQFAQLTVNNVLVVPLEGLTEQVPFSGGKFVFRSSELDPLADASKEIAWTRQYSTVG